MTLQLGSIQRKRSSNKSKPSPAGSVNTSSSSKQQSYVPLLPQVRGIHIGIHGQVEILSKGGQIQTKEHWTTEALVDELKNHILQVKEKNQQQCNSQGSYFYGRKYLNLAVEFIANWSKVAQNNQHHEFVFYISDIMTDDGRLAAELIDLSHTTPSTLAYVLHKVVGSIFEMIGASWFYQSASEETMVRIS
jgi:hypothetical protein